MSWIQSDLQQTEAGYIPPTWADGTDEEIVEALEKHYNNEIDLTEYWSVGDERTVHLSAMSSGIGESGHIEQDQIFVLLNLGGKTLTTPINGHTECTFIVGQKQTVLGNDENEHGAINSTRTNTGGWDSCARRTWCNEVYYNAIPSTLRPIFKQYQNITANNGTKASSIISNDYFALPAEREVFGSRTYANNTIESVLSRFTWFDTSSNRRRYTLLGNVSTWWMRSPYDGDTRSFCYVSTDNTPVSRGGQAYTNYGIAPFGVI